VTVNGGQETSLLLPCFTLHAVSSFKSKGFYYTARDLRNHSYAAEEVFDAGTLARLRSNDSLYYFREAFSVYFGACFTICHLKPVAARSFNLIRVKR
jgi:hypothetical protein